MIFGVWFPKGMASFLGGTELYKIIVVVELLVGPVMSLIIYNHAKGKFELLTDYLIIAALQFSALVYGLIVVYESRPVFEVFAKDSIFMVVVGEFSEDDFVGADTSFSEYSVIDGPKRVCVSLPTDPLDKKELMLSALGGKDVQYYPKYYRDCMDGELNDAALDAESLEGVVKDKGIDIDLPRAEFTWLPVISRFGAVVEIYPQGNIDEAYYLGIDPF